MASSALATHRLFGFAGKFTLLNASVDGSVTCQTQPSGLDAIIESGRIFEAWSDEGWVNDGAAVRVSLVCFATDPVHPVEGQTLTLDGLPVTAIAGLNITAAKPLPENCGASFHAPVLVGRFEVEVDLAQTWLAEDNLGTK